MPASLSRPISSMISCRSTVGLLGRQRTAQLVVAGAIGHRLDRQRQGSRCRYWPGRIDIALPRQDVEYDVAPEQPGRQRLGTGRLDGVEPGLGNRGQDIDELAIAVVMAG